MNDTVCVTGYVYVNVCVYTHIHDWLFSVFVYRIFSQGFDQPRAITLAQNATQRAGPRIYLQICSSKRKMQTILEQ